MSEPHRTAADRNLLFGILALQMDFITRDALIRAMNAWVLEKAKSLGEILVEQGAMGTDARALLEPLVQKHVQMHGDDAGKSLASVGSVGSARQVLEQIGDADVQASLAQLPAAGSASGDAWPTLPPSVGTPTSSGLRFRVLRPHAKGGLGQVSVALDEELRREVALKEIQDRHADHPDSRARFLLEAEVTGGLEHPGIVPVYGLGTYPDGRPFYAMRFIKGDSLQDAIERFHTADSNKRDPHERTLALRRLLGRFLDVCNAIAYAHSRGVLHRDLKPGNIMLGPYGETLVVDWGLAKPMGARTADADATVAEQPLQPVLSDSAARTQAGAAIGTPAYMPPEQAAGRLDELGPASDVYSLGATLYCLLTGRPPLEGGDVGQILRRVENGDFPRPREVHSGVPAALEAVCLKAMALAPGDRYPSPRALAADVERWLADEPVSAWREPWQVRAGRWARRHRALVTSAAAAMLALLLSAVPAFLLILASRNDALRSEQKALTLATEKSELADEKGRLAIANEDLADKRLSSAARSLVQPLHFQVSPAKSLPPLNNPEIEALWTLGTTTDQKLRLRFVEEAIRNPITTRQLRDRREFALQAMVGLDAGRRKAVERRLVERVSGEKLPLEQKVDLSLILTALGDIGSQTRREVAATLVLAMTNTTDPYNLGELSKSLAVVAARLDKKEAATPSAQAAALLIQAMRYATKTDELAELSESLAAVAALLEEKEAAAVCAEAATRITAAMQHRVVASLGLSTGLAAVAAYLESREVATLLDRELPRPRKVDRLGRVDARVLVLTEGLGARLEPKDAGQVAARLAQTMSEDRDCFELFWLSRSLAVVAARLESKDATASCARAATILTTALTKTKDMHELQALSQAMGALARRLEVKEATEAAASLTQAMNKTTDGSTLLVLSESLVVVADYLEPKEAAASCANAAAILTEAMKKTTDPYYLGELSHSFAVLAARLRKKEAREVAALLTQAMSKTQEPYDLANLSQGVEAVAARLEERETAAYCADAATLLTQAISKTTKPDELELLLESLAAVAAHLEPKESATLLTLVISKSADPVKLKNLSPGLAAVAARLESKEAVALLNQAISKTTKLDEVEVLSESLAAVAARLDPKEAAALLTNVISRNTRHAVSKELSWGVAAVLTREPKTRRRQRFRSIGGSVGLAGSPASLPSILAVMTPARDTLPQPLPTEMLVELLKHPLCVGDVRLVVLAALGTRYHRTFTDQWDFVRFATEQHLNLDFTSPPKRLELAADAAKP